MHSAKWMDGSLPRQPAGGHASRNVICLPALNHTNRCSTTCHSGLSHHSCNPPSAHCVSLLATHLHAHSFTSSHSFTNSRYLFCTPAHPPGVMPRVRELCIQRGEAWASSLARVVCSEQDYYEQLVATYQSWARVSDIRRMRHSMAVTAMNGGGGDCSNGQSTCLHLGELVHTPAVNLRE
jgi:hypothetical protein